MADKIVEQETEERVGFGTQPAFNTLLKRFQNHRIPVTGLMLVNLDTLVRNTANPNLQVQDVVSKVCTYMKNMSTDFAEVVKSWNTLKHYIIFYHADAANIVPSLFRRKHEGPTAVQAKEALANLIERLKETPDQTVGNCTSMVRLAKEIKQPSYKGLVELCNKLTDRSVTIHMISHCPIDWHIQRLGRIGVMYRSYTGVAVEMTPAKLGGIVFDTPNVPFYPVTHQLLGDKTFIKGILIKKEKENFLELAKMDKFVFRSEMFINTHRRINKSIIPYKLD